VPYLQSLILMGHDVRPATKSASRFADPDTAVRIDAMTDVLEQLRDEGYRFVSFDDFMKWRRRGGVALLTFDDAYRSVAQLAQPVLERMAIPALVFVVTGSLAHRGDPFPHWLDELMDNWSAIPGDAAKAIASHPAVQNVLAATQFPSLGELFTLQPESARDAFEFNAVPSELQELAGIVADTPALSRRTMDGDDLREMLRTGLMEIGAHSTTHRAFVRLSPAECETEIIESTNIVADICGKPPASLAFAYPYGFITAHAVATVSRLCRAGFTCQARPFSRIDRSAMLPRFNLDRQLPNKARLNGSMNTMIASAREGLLLYVRTDTGRRITDPIRKITRIGSTK
jgi:peptidoglycan/xylan/chitin deacetylase (PgdA/CDA1 family)